LGIAALRNSRRQSGEVAVGGRRPRVSIINRTGHKYGRALCKMTMQASCSELLRTSRWLKISQGWGLPKNGALCDVLLGIVSVSTASCHWKCVYRASMLKEKKGFQLLSSKSTQNKEVNFKNHVYQVTTMFHALEHC
jgi:hypothetical protein